MVMPSGNVCIVEHYFEFAQAKGKGTLTIHVSVDDTVLSQGPHKANSMGVIIQTQISQARLMSQDGLRDRIEIDYPADLLEPEWS